MGAVDFKALGFGKTAGQAFANARSEARAEYGNQPYTGSIAEKSEYKLSGANPVAWDEALRRAKRYMAYRESDNGLVPVVPGPWHDKWGPALAIPVDPATYPGDIPVNGWRPYIFVGVASC
jgi:hypothetical protein